MRFYMLLCSVNVIFRYHLCLQLRRDILTGKWVSLVQRIINWLSLSSVWHVSKSVSKSLHCAAEKTSCHFTECKLGALECRPNGRRFVSDSHKLSVRSPSRLAWSEGRLALCYVYQMNDVNCRNDFDIMTVTALINIVMSNMLILSVYYYR